jgi:glycosyltransferase involved in cell wall biosynthesis
MSPKRPCIRVSIPALNEAATIERALSALADQTYPRDHYAVVVVVDSATHDRTVEIARAGGVDVIIDDRFHTIGGATGLGFSDTDADIVASTHADSFVDREWLSIIAENLAYGTGIDGVGGPLCARPGSGLMPHVAYAFTNNVYRALGYAFSRTFYAGPNYAYRRSLYERAGGLGRTLRAGDDNDLSIRAGRLGRLVYDPRMRVYTSERRFREGYCHTLVSYGKLFFDINRGVQPERFNHLR